MVLYKGGRVWGQKWLNAEAVSRINSSWRAAVAKCRTARRCADVMLSVMCPNPVQIKQIFTITASASCLEQLLIYEVG